MSSLSGSNKRARTAQVSVRMRQEDLELVGQASDAMGVSKPAFLLALFYQWRTTKKMIHQDHLTAACRGRSIKSR